MCRDCPSGKRKTKHSPLSVLEVVKNDVKTLAVLTVILDHDTAAANDLTRIALTVNFAETSPSTEDLGITELD